MITVFAVSADKRETALSLLFSRMPDDERVASVAEVIQAEAEGSLRLDGLLMAEAHGKPLGAALTMVQEDDALFVWPAIVYEAATSASPFSIDEVADAILQRVGQQIDNSGAWIGQCLIDCNDTADRAAFSRNGFAHLADLIFMKRVFTTPLPEPADLSFETVPFDPVRNREHFAAMLEKTYVGTHDCPELNGWRTGAQALAGHQAVGKFDARFWKIYRVAGREIGALLLSPHPDQNAWELVYMGLVPEARGNGYGRGMLLAGLYEARAAGMDSVFLAVDSRNQFAKNTYDGLGFTEIAVRAVHVRKGNSYRPAAASQ